MLRFRMSPLVCGVLLVTSMTASAAARDIFVDNVSGDDRSDGRTAASGQGVGGPVRTLAKALRICEKADRIVLANQGVPYHEVLSLSAGKHWGLPNQPFTIIGNGAILDGSLPVPPRAWEFEFGDVFSYVPPRIAYQQLYLAGKPAERKLFEVPSSTPRTLKPLEWMFHEGRLYFRPEPAHLPEDYELSYMGLQTGITLYHVHNVRIENLIVQGFQQDGINFHDGCHDCTLINVTARGNGRSGVSVGGSSRALLENCVVGDNGKAQIRTEGYCVAEVLNSEIVANSAPSYVVTGGRLYVEGEQIQAPGR